MESSALGARNPRLRRLRRLTDRSAARAEEGVFVIDGPRLVVEAIDAGIEIRELFGGRDELAAVGDARAFGPEVERFTVDPSVLSSFVDPVNPQALAAVAAMPTWSVADVVAADGPVLVAVELRDPGNLGTILRTAEAAGLAGVIVAGDSVDRFSPKVVRAAAGSLFRLPVAADRDPLAVLGQLEAAGRATVATVVDADAPAHDTVDLRSAAILVGNEPKGLPAEVVAAADATVTIPMAAGVESLNVAAATAVLCFEAARQRRREAPEARNPLDSHRSRAEGVHNDVTTGPDHSDAPTRRQPSEHR